MKYLGFGWRIYFVALILRLIPVLLTRSLGIGLDDMFQYDMLARSIAVGQGYRWYAQEDLTRLEPYVDFDLKGLDYDPARGVPTSFRAPLYPSFLALIYILAGTGVERFFVARLVQAAVTALLAPLTFKVARHLFPGSEPACVISAWLVACYPLLVIYPIGLATENLFFVLLWAAILFLLQIPASQPSKNGLSLTTVNAFLSGIFLSLAILTRSVIMPFAGLAVFWVWFSLKNKRAAFIMVLTLLMLVSPWMIRNSILHHKLTGVESSMGYNLYLGYHPEGDGSFVFGPSLDLLTILDDAEREQVGMHQALGFIHEAPGRILPLTLNRLRFFFGLEKRALIYWYSNNLLGALPPLVLLAIAGVLLLPFVILMPSAMLGLTLIRLRPKIILIYLLAIAYILPHILILSEDRFHMALIPVLAMLAARAWTGGKGAFIERWRESSAGKVAVVLGIFAALLLFVNWGFELSREADKIALLLAPYGNQTHFPY